MMLAGEDRIVSTEAALALAASAGSTVEVRRYEALYHELFLEPERDQVIADIAAWIADACGDPARAPQFVPGII
jgi:alpha-beta hydrolase superfamily lysophospholipase